DELVLQARGEDFRERLVELSAVPPAVHVRFAEAEGPVSEHPPEEALVVDAQVEGAESVDLDVGLLEQLGDAAARDGRFVLDRFSHGSATIRSPAARAAGGRRRPSRTASGSAA